MELFIPSLAFILAAVAIAFFVLPNAAPAILVGGSVVTLIGALYVHWSKFGVMEYERSTWQFNLRKYSSYVIIIAVLLGAYGFYAMNTGAAESMIPSVSANVATPALPPIETPLIGGGFSRIAKTATSRIQELMRNGHISSE